MLFAFVWTGNFTAHATPIPADSVRLEVSKDGTQAWIIHEVEPKETLYSLAKRYGVSVEEIQAANPKLQVLKIGDLVRIPYKKYRPVLYSAQRDTLKGVKKHTVQAGETLYRISKQYGVEVEDIKRWNQLADNSIYAGQVLIVSDPRQTTYASKQENSAAIVHEVQEGEYLYVIAKRYGVKVSDIKEWNRLESDALDIGQKLTIYPKKRPETTPAPEQNTPKEQPAPKEKQVKETPKPKNTEPSVANESQVPDESHTPEYEDAVQTVEVAGYKKIIEKGMGEVIEDESVSSYVGLHKDAPIGTIIAVKNQANGENVFVRIIGKLPEADVRNKVIIKISKAAYEALGAKGKRFPVEVSYIP